MSELAVLGRTFLAFAELDSCMELILNSQKSMGLCTHRGQLIKNKWKKIRDHLLVKDQIGVLLVAFTAVC